jgi:hypothetical protein
MTAIGVREFDLWQDGYGLSTVSIFLAGTNTLATVYDNINLTGAPVANPQILIERMVGGISYGRWAVPIYVGVPYELEINTIDHTGVVQPGITTLVGADASDALVTVTGGTVAAALDDREARRIDVRDYGIFLAVGAPGASASTNNATLVIALGVAAAAGAGYVEIPAGTYQVTFFTIPQGVVIRGSGRDATDLQSVTAGNVATIGGIQAGLSRMTLDGISLVVNSVGVFAANVDQILLDDVEIMRFETGLELFGGKRNNWRDLFISDCVNGYRAWGYTGGNGTGGPLLENQWIGGQIDTCTTIGIELRNFDQPCEHNRFTGITFDSNTATAVNIIGGRYFSFVGCRWIGNTVNLAIDDASPATSTNTVIGGEFIDGEMNTGALNFTGTYQEVSFRRMTMVNPAITINAPGQNIVAQDCQISSPTFSGVETCWLYSFTNNRGAAFVVTFGPASATAWSIFLKDGQQVYLEGKVIGRQRDGINTGFFHIAVSAGRPGASLAYNTLTAVFGLGQVLTGQTSGATARITADSGTVLTLQDIVDGANGGFAANEIITDTASGSATAGIFSESNAALAGTVTSIRAAQRTDASWTATFAANGAYIDLNVAGDTSMSVEWSVDVDVLTEQGTALVVAQQGSLLALGYHAASGAQVFGIGNNCYDANTGAHGLIVAEHNTGATGTLLLSNVLDGFAGGFLSGDALFNAIPPAPHVTQAFNN